MALINCPECGRENVSDTAESCPGCGYGIRAHYAKLSEERQQKEQELRDKERKEERIKSVPKPAKPNFAIVAIVTVIALLIVVYFAYKLMQYGTENKKLFYGSMFQFLPTVLGAIVVVVLIFKDYKKKKDTYILAQENFEEYQKQFAKRVELRTDTVTIKPHCPYCNSTNVKKITGMSKAGSIALWGVFAMGKTSKNFHCNNCKSNF